MLKITRSVGLISIIGIFLIVFTSCPAHLVLLLGCIACICVTFIWWAIGGGRENILSRVNEEREQEYREMCVREGREYTKRWKHYDTISGDDPGSEALLGFIVVVMGGTFIFLVMAMLSVAIMRCLGVLP